MAPSMVLLKREVAFSDNEAVSGGESICDDWEAREEQPSRKEMIEPVTEYLRTFKGDAVFASPPELSSLHILRPPQPVGLPWACGNLDSGHLSSADKNLVALYAGAHMMTMGGYLIYDARNNSLSAIPQCSRRPRPSRRRVLLGRRHVHRG
ncbi:hypothetical protein ZWY2020_046192 [Hordeum vulgare]|nr:hypothetical protein ZWY2020_046192 [Hordeum vulgare]